MRLWPRLRCRHEDDRMWEIQESDGGVLHVYLRCSRDREIVIHHILAAWEGDPS